MCESTSGYDLVEKKEQCAPKRYTAQSALRGDAMRAIVEEPERLAVRRIMGRYGWTTLGEDALERRILQHYALALYEGCRQAGSLELRERAYTDLFRYLYRAAARRWPTAAEDITQQALHLVYAQIERCKHPEAFLKFALFKLWGAARELQRREARTAEPLSEALIGADEETVSAAALEAGCSEALLVAVARLEPRRRDMVLLRYIYSLADDEIAARYRMTPANVRTLRSRALAELRDDPVLRAECGDAV
jgi:RNA polymerase sigma factor (sigma-70 family)